MGIRAGDHGLAHLNSCRSKDVALLAIGVEEQCQTRVAVRVVVNRGHLGGDTVLVATEIHHAIEALVATTAAAAGDHTAVVAALAAVFGHHHGPLRLAAGDLT